MADKMEKLTGDSVVVHVPPGASKNVKVVESDPASRGQDITIQVSREKKSRVSNTVGVIVK